MLRIFIFQPESNDGCTWYRLSQFASYLNRNKLAEVAFMDHSWSAESLSKAVIESDVIIVRLNEAAHFLFSQFDMERLNKPIILDIDDNYEDIDPLSDSYQTMGTKDVYLPDGTPLWVTGKNGFNRDENFDRLQMHKKIMSKASAIFVTTLTLKNYAEQYNDTVVVIPNCINPDLFPDVKIEKNSNVNIVWSGGSSHYSDLYEIVPVLQEVMKEYPQVHYHHVGQMFRSIIKSLPKERTHYWGWLHPQAHGFRLICTGGNIGICPLVDNTFNTYKSSIKFYEYSMAGMATVAKGITPYTDDIKNGYSGLLYDTPEELRDALVTLIKDPIRRMELAANARKYVVENRLVPDQAKDWLLFIETVAKSHLNGVKTPGVKKILFSLAQYHSLTGSELYHYELAREYVRRGHSVTITAPEVGSTIASRTRDLGVRVIRRELLTDLKYDICHSSQYEPTEWASKNLECPIVQTIHSEVKALEDYEQPYRGENVKEYIAIREQIRDKYKNVSPHLIFNPFDTARFNTQGRKSSKKLVLFVGTIDFLRHDAIMDLVKQAKEGLFELYLVGENKGGYIEPDNKHVFMFPPTWHIEKYIKSCDMTAGIMMGRSTIEGWLCGKPGIIYTIDDMGKVVDKKTHLPPDNLYKFDSKYVADQILKVYKKLW